ncbi:MAG: trpS [Acidobacteria bacterium]|nr:trpS [Acidobacteriota bacterium]
MRILSGVQPSGKLHIGNYFGAIRQFVEMQDQPGNECYYFIADLHAMTTIRSGAELRANSRMVAADFLALGLDPRRSILYRQSDVPEVTELAWMLSTVTPMGLLQRGHSYKDKVAKGMVPNHGLFAYPVLMAADILIVRADRVPVGRDQKQHLEMTRDIAAAFNQAYGDPVLRVPEEMILPDVAVVPGIDGQKMSKSYGNTLEIFAPEAELKKRVMSIGRSRPAATRSTPCSSCSRRPRSGRTRSAASPRAGPVTASSRSACSGCCSSGSAKPAGGGPSWSATPATSSRCCATATTARWPSSSR